MFIYTFHNEFNTQIYENSVFDVRFHRFVSKLLQQVMYVSVCLCVVMFVSLCMCVARKFYCFKSKYLR